MPAEQNTLLMRLEGPLQSWGIGGKIVFRPTELEPTKSGIIGLLAAAMGVPRTDRDSVQRLAAMRVGVRVDRQGEVLRDYHTVGAGIGNITAAGKVKKTQGTGEVETLLSVRTYLQDASFVASVQHDDTSLIADCSEALQNPAWQPFLGRKACPPSAPLLIRTGDYSDALEALRSVPWQRRHEREEPPESLRCLIEASPDDPAAIERRDHPEYFWRDTDHQFAKHWPRYVRHVNLTTSSLPAPEGPVWSGADTRRRGYSSVRPDGLWAKTIRPLARARAKAEFNDLCVLTGLPYDHIHHIRYRDDIPENADETDPQMQVLIEHHVAEDLVPVSALAHDAITMLEYWHNMDSVRIDPRDSSWRPKIIEVINHILTKRMRPRGRSGVRRS